MRDIIEINKDLIPYQFDILLGSDLFTLRVDYNKAADLFTIGLYKDGEMICAGEPLIYGVPLFSDIFTVGQYPEIDIVPLDESGQESAVTWDNFGKTVFLTIDDEGMEEADSSG
jgi:hypothetical protein